MRKVKQETDFKFVNLYTVEDLGHNVKRFEFAERRGKDSIAFVGIDRNTKEIILTNEFCPPVGKFITRAFGGSLDNPDLSMSRIVEAEVLEEAGYKVEQKDICFVGKSFVSSMMNQYCFLYVVDLTDATYVGRTTTDKVEQLSSVVRADEDEIVLLDDWKAITILAKYNNPLERN